ncbi:MULTISPECIES: class I SAM-dependent methyltransferase [unclassified Thalassotalea]|uniref:class I SAM-dependent methyltransferase n=1 Tax=unclassified Thalassotalea TaxID=2614972 RepID=UPI00108015CC|nr:MULTISPECIES: class I SAM-dependent methyltransferase [unclassified Thalassotalea]NMP17488.1 methyltransferase domain-containing protein [Thalassotalea sp. Y01]QBY06086.1 SAM-dependent methyltransferase [Thalassotalea sp. HSM 43]
MKPALAFDNPKKPMRWHDMACGELIAEQINQHLANWWPRMFGYHLLKLGDLSGEIDCSASKISHQVSVNEDKNSANVIAEIDDLPFLDSSVDACLLTQQLEFAVDPHHILREADRVLIPNGYLIISGFNPISLAGLNQIIPYRRQVLPWQGRFFTPMRVKDWLNLLGYEVLDDKRMLFSSLHPKINADGWWFKMCQRFAGKYLSSIGSVYVIVAKKRVHPLTPIRPKWQIRPKFRPIKVSTLGQNRS